MRGQFTAPAAGNPAACSSPPRSSRAGTSTRSRSPPAGRSPRRSRSARRRASALPALSCRRFAPDSKKEPAFDNLTVETHHDTVTWSAPIELAAGVDPAKLKIEGKVTVQPCDANSCLPPTPIRVCGHAGSGESGAACGFAAGRHAADAGQRCQPPAFDLNALKIVENDQIRQTSMAWAILMGFVGGLILNLMPCVLPVIGLKILSFLEQSGHSRATPCC